MSDHNEKIAGRPDKRISVTALTGLAAALVAVGMAAIAVIGYRSGELHFVTAVRNFQWAAYTAIGALLVSLAGLWLARPRGPRRGMIAGLLGAALSLPLVVFIANFEYAARAYPPINDITTDTEDPPAFWDVPKPTIYPGGKVADLQRAAYPDLESLDLALQPEPALEMATDVAREMGWEIVSRNSADLQIEAVDTTLLFGFKDNVAVRLRPDNGHTRVDVRSQSRLGRIDRGVNARRIRAYLDALAQRAAAGEQGT